MSPRTKTYTKTCQRSGVEFQASGPAAKYCGTCDKCTAAAPSSTKPAKKKKKKAEIDRPRPRIDTGFRAESPVGDSRAEPCGVEGCPGTIDEANECRCCIAREKYRAKHLPARKCGVCIGDLPDRVKGDCCAPCAKLLADVDRRAKMTPKRSRKPA